MALNKRDRFSFRWSKSELPDNDDINTQVLLLGITRFETTPSPVPSKNLLSTDSSKNHKINSKDNNQLNASIEQLNKSTGCFPLDRHKTKKTINKESELTKAVAVGDAIYVASSELNETENNQCIEQKSHRNHFDRLVERFQRKRLQQNLGVNRTPQRDNSIEQKAFYHWLHLNRNKRLEQTVKYFDDADRQQNLCMPVIRKRSTKSNSIRRVTKKTKKSSSSRFSSCIPYCGTTLSRNGSFADNSLASSHRYTDYYRKRSGASASIGPQHRHRSPSKFNDCLMHSHCKSNKHCSPSNKNTNNSHNNNCSLFHNLNIMDRSVDSIGSCSLDVDAESTDFSDTSGSLNVVGTPLSGKDFTREFTSRIHERCQFPLSGQKLQQTKTVLDPNSGKISTQIIISQNISQTINSPTSPVKKPSYLNLACCVNGYSNLTTYDSKFRQSINKSREVSPIRPITYALQYNNRNTLNIPTSVPIDDNTKNFIMDTQSILTPDKRYYSTTTQQKTIEMNGTSHDVIDNVNSNGCGKYFARSMLHTSTSTNGSGNTSLSLVRDVNQEFEANGKGTAKSFIQQRVERLYGPAAVTQGLYSPKKPKSSDDNQETSMRTSISSVLVEKSQNSTNTATTFQSTKYVLEAQRNGHLNGFANNRTAHDDDDENISLESLNEALPVLRHLRPEFRAQLPTLSPKRTVAISKLTPSPSQSAPASITTTTHTHVYTNSTADNGKLKSNRCTLDMQSHKQQQQQSSAFNASNETTKNGCLTSNKSHDIENDSREKLIESPTKSSNTIATDLDTQNTSKTFTSNDKQDHIINNTQMATDITEQVNYLIESPQNSVKICQQPTNNQSSSGERFDDCDTTNMATNANGSTVEAMDANGNHNKDGVYYLNIVQSERDRLINLAVIIEKELDELLEKGDVEEEVLGHIRSAAGKARLLATKKFKQFEGLCIDNINQITRDMPPPTPADLQGFWEMVLLQVENVDYLYAELDKLRANGWKKLTQAKAKRPQGPKQTKRPLTTSLKSGTTSTAQSPSGTTKKSAAALVAAQKREAQRKQLAEMRRKNKLAMANIVNDDVIIDTQQVGEASEEPSTQSNSTENSTENETDR
ncbi:uncharacterized protein LOC116339925 isoform X2 [Contarinia nasturtii]|uniref:uncharacterized protein LOC116339925 isoform X2 n=1 Tax=Contarinia nasturtii TaxID=265458 RepID=UPI0012D41A6C|nr:uncharacterized protein LOC116339925 isoform X2 [Contarinia nasturtii]